MVRIKSLKLISAFLTAVILLLSINTVVFADNGKNVVVGKLYKFNEDSDYKFSKSKKSKPTDSENTYGEFSVNGNVSEIFSKDGVPAYKVESGNLKFTYSYSDKLLNAGKDEWHLEEDSGKKIDTVSLDEKILNGAIIIQTSKDQKNWVTVGMGTNVFETTPVNTKSMYTTQDIQLINGCFYRVIVAYELTRRTEESNFLFINTDDYEYKKYAEVYDFYACYPSTVQESDVTQKYNLGTAVRVEHFDGYEGEKEIEKDDPHYGITLGQFFVSGYTDTAVDKNNNQVFLKNVGDKVTLWFNLKENINAIGGNEDITVTQDEKGYDQYFQTKPTDFGRGALIIRYTDYNNVSKEPQIYTNYLEANASVGADTKVSLFEEGDYEVALDYEITEDKFIDSEGHYRIFFKFSIRNGNCMVYPFDLETGDELTNSSMTENGFRLDLAKSRYLKVAVKREIMADSADGLVEDTRFNGPAKDGAEYREEGIYTITVSNQYTNQLTVKKIYVGNNSVLRAYMTTGLSIKEINNLVADGATINDDGSISIASSNQEPLITSDPEDLEAIETDTSDETSADYTVIIVVAGVLCLVAIVAVVLVIVRKKKKVIAKTEAEKSDDVDEENIDSEDCEGKDETNNESDGGSEE